MRFFSVLLLFLFLATPAMAQVAIPVSPSSQGYASTSTTNSNAANAGSNSSGVGLGIGLGIGVAAGIGLAASLATPAATVASNLLVRSFGGRIIAVIPCISPLGPSLFVTIVPAGIFSPAYVWTPATITKLYGPPRNPGQQILGKADILFACKVGAVPLVGWRMTTVGTSAAF